MDKGLQRSTRPPLPHCSIVWESCRKGGGGWFLLVQAMVGCWTVNLCNWCPLHFLLGSWEYYALCSRVREGCICFVMALYAWCCCLKDCLHCTSLPPYEEGCSEASMELHAPALVGWCSCSGWGSGGAGCLSIHCALSDLHLYRCVHSVCTCTAYLLAALTACVHAFLLPPSSSPPHMYQLAHAHM